MTSEGSKNYITPRGLETLQAELRELRQVERPKVVQTVSWAASNGDRSENGDYIYGKRRLREIDRRIRFLIKRIEAVQVVDPATIKSKKIVFGASVEIEYTEGKDEGRKRVFEIVGEDETAPAEGRISWRSPIARALLGAAAGDAVTLRTPGGPEGGIEVEILRVWYGGK